MNFLRRESPIDIQATRNLMRQQAMIDNAPVGSVGAPGGLLGMASPQRGPNYANGTPAAGLGNDAASGLALSDVARGIVEAKERFALNRATAEACQAWARKITAHGTAHFPEAARK